MDNGGQTGATPIHGQASNVYMITRNNSSDVPDTPTDTPPSDHFANPVSYSGDTWKAWWPSPPSDRSMAYEIEDPPSITPPVEMDRLNNFAYTVKAQVGASAWSTPERYMFRCMCDLKPLSGKEQMDDFNEVTTTVFSAYIPISKLLRDQLSGEAPFAKKWDIVVDGIPRDIVSAYETHDRKHFRVMMSERTSEEILLPADDERVAREARESVEAGKNQGRRRVQGATKYDKLIQILYDEFPESGRVNVWTAFADVQDDGIIAIKSGGDTLSGGRFFQESHTEIQLVSQAKHSVDASDILRRAVNAIMCSSTVRLSSGSASEQDFANRVTEDGLFQYSQQIRIR